VERYPKRVKEKEVNDTFDFIFRNALGNIIIFTSSPSKSQMKANTIGYYNDEIFFKLANGELKKVSVTDVS